MTTHQHTKIEFKPMTEDEQSQAAYRAISGWHGGENLRSGGREMVDETTALRLYAFQPKGHGQASFFVMAANEEEAIAAIDKFIEEEKAKASDDEFADVHLDDYDVDGWKTDYYKLTVLERGQVVENDND
jgi:hypothetical protein